MHAFTKALGTVAHVLVGHLPTNGFPSDHPRAERRVPREWRG